MWWVVALAVMGCRWVEGAKAEALRVNQPNSQHLCCQSEHPAHEWKKERHLSPAASAIDTAKLPHLTVTNSGVARMTELATRALYGHA